MKICFIAEYFPPFAPGGAEWSMYYLALDLLKKGHDITVITPNYGDKAFEIRDDIKIIRFPFYIKLKEKNKFLGNFAFTNPLWNVWLTMITFYYLSKEKFDLVHVHGKYSIISAKLVTSLLRIPLILTIRDYQIICNYGVCLLNSYKSCNLVKYFTNDFLYYLRHYVRKLNMINIISNIIFAIWGRLSGSFIKHFAINCNVVVLSNEQKNIFLANNFKSVSVIGNSFNFPKEILLSKKENFILFAGRLTTGKGINVLIDILDDFFTEFSKYRFIFAGNGFLREDLKKNSKKYKGVKVLGDINHMELLKLYKKAKVVVVPSVWPEPFGRIALEALSQATPTIVSDRGGLKEIINDKRWGYVVSPNKVDLLNAIRNAIKNQECLSTNIKNDWSLIINRFGDNITDKYINLYKRVTK